MRRPRPYERLNFASHDEWLLARKDYLTASSVATVLGDNPYQTLDALIAEKKSTKPSQQNAAMWWGSRCERVILGAYGDITGARVRPSNAMLVHNDLPLACTLDGLVLHPELPRARNGASVAWCVYPGATPPGRVLGVIDAKNVASRNRSKWTSPKPPRYYWWQIQTQLYVTGLDYGILVAKVDSSELYAHCIEATPEGRLGVEEAVEIYVERIRHG